MQPVSKDGIAGFTGLGEMRQCLVGAASPQLEIAPSEMSLLTRSGEPGGLLEARFNPRCSQTGRRPVIRLVTSVGPGLRFLGHRPSQRPLRIFREAALRVCDVRVERRLSAKPLERRDGRDVPGSLGRQRRPFPQHTAGPFDDIGRRRRGERFEVGRHPEGLVGETHRGTIGDDIRIRVDQVERVGSHREPAPRLLRGICADPGWSGLPQILE